jgi:hypothetical protein
MFQLTPEEWAALRSQNVTSNAQRGGRRYLPYAFTEHGVKMLSSILRSDRAIAVNIQIKRVFVRMRDLINSNRELCGRPTAARIAGAPPERAGALLDKKLTTHDQAIAAILSAIRKLMHPPGPKRRPGPAANPLLSLALLFDLELKKSPVLAPKLNVRPPRRVYSHRAIII